MTVQEKVTQAIKDLPADATLEQVMERLVLVVKIEKGIAQADAGQTVSHEYVVRGMAKKMSNRCLVED